MSVTLPSITVKQQQVLTLLYTYRFLTTLQLQRFMGHHHKGRTLIWLRDLRAKGYIAWRYDTSSTGRTKPAVYYLDRRGISWLRASGQYAESELRKRYDEHTRRPAYMETCRLVADTALAVGVVTGGEHYAWATPADYGTWGPSYETLQQLQPALVLIRQVSSAAGIVSTSYLLEFSRRSATPLLVRQRLKAYLRYLSAADWQDAFTVCPIVLFVVPDTTSLPLAKRYIRRTLPEAASELPLRLATLDAVSAAGIHAAIWERAVKR